MSAHVTFKLLFRVFWYKK